MTGAADADKVVLDTNVVLDWLVFEDPVAKALGEQICNRSLSWLVSEALRVELAHVLARRELEAWRPDTDRLWAHWERYAQSAPALTLSRSTPKCTDPDDQKFIDLALVNGVRWLISRDKAVLKVGRRCRGMGLGLDIVTPAAWAATQGVSVMSSAGPTG